ncbi:MAG: sulfotransferase [Deltaproteobacteria bacterium]|nr:sulfotransferase [Deltaproteobacteria bacterium]
MMNDWANSDSFVFIIGSPRSGTTVLGEILDKHHEISQWYEPYFVWDRYFRNHPHDKRNAEEATSKIKKQIFTEFLRYKRKTGSRIVVDKSPRNSLKIPFIMRIFPQARFIHLLRDGRDVTLSIHKEWIRRRKIVQNSQNNNKFNYKRAFRVVKEWLNRQPFLKDKIRSLWFETHGHFFNKTLHLNRLRWNGEIGWGPRFKGWNEFIYQKSMLKFNAYQWLRCVENIGMYWPEIPAENKLELRYEDLISESEKNIINILEFLDLRKYEEFFHSVPKLKKDNFNKWRNEFSREQANEVHEILTPMLIKLGYAKNHDWPSLI